MPLVKTFAAACKAKGLDAKAVLPDVSMVPVKHRKAIIASVKLFIIAEVLNDGWVPNWKDWGQRKWVVYWEMDGAGGFRFDGSYYAGDRSGVGSRLCYKDEATADFAAAHFKKEYQDLFCLPALKA